MGVETCSGEGRREEVAFAKGGLVGGTVGQKFILTEFSEIFNSSSAAEVKVGFSLVLVTTACHGS